MNTKRLFSALGAILLPSTLVAIGILIFTATPDSGSLWDATRWPTALQIALVAVVFFLFLATAVPVMMVLLIAPLFVSVALIAVIERFWRWYGRLLLSAYAVAKGFWGREGQ